MANLLTREEKVEIVLIVGENYKTHREAANIFNNRHQHRNIGYSTVRKILNKFKTSGSIENNFKNKRRKRVANEDTEFEVMLSVVEEPKMSIRKRASLITNTSVSKDTVANILKRHKYHAYKPQFVHTLLPRDYDIRFEFCALIQGKLEEDPLFTRSIIFSDEATFSSNGTVSSQNCRWWSISNPNFVIKSRNQYSFKTNVWCGIYKNKLIGPFFFDIA